MKAFMCDECGEFATYLPITVSVHIADVLTPTKHVDLCEACIVDQAVTDSVHGKSNWYLEKAEEFTAAVERSGYQKSVRGIMPGPFGW